FSSTATRVHVPYLVTFPPGTSPGDPLPVCAVLPGRATSERAFIDVLNLPDHLALGMRTRGVPAFALASVGGHAGYWHRRRDGRDWMAMLLDELLPLLRRAHHLPGPGRGTALMGWSMGGYGALLAAVRRPGAFAAVAAE